MPPKAKGAKKKNGYQMPEKFNEGFQLKDLMKTTWTLGKPIGQGGFGLIYLAAKSDQKVDSDAQYVVKIEPKDNGPLFCETHFYVNCAKEDDLKAFMRSNNLKHLAIPRYISSGLCNYSDKDYRFLVMDRYAKDLQSFINQANTRQINEVAVLYLTRQVLYALEYIHQRGYSHGDIKGANLMLRNDQQSYLVDFGLAYRFMRENTHQKYEVKPERRHNGTIEYTSRDAHNGAQVYRRSDLEILGYCMVHWLAGTLPWIDLITSPEKVQQSKEQSMANVKEFLNKTFAMAQKPINDLVKNFTEFYLNEVNKLQFDTEPPYAKLHTKLNETLSKLGESTSLENFRLFKPSAGAETGKTPSRAQKESKATPAKQKKTSGKAKIEEHEEEEEIEEKVAAVAEKKPIKVKKEEKEEKPVKKLMKQKEVLNELSDLDEDLYIENEKTRSSKKARKNLHSTAVIENESRLETFKSKLTEELAINAKRIQSPAKHHQTTNLKENHSPSSVCSPRSMRATARRNYKEHDELNELDEEEDEQYGKSSAKSTSRTQQQTASEFIGTNRLLTTPLKTIGAQHASHNFQNTINSNCGVAAANAATPNKLVNKLKTSNMGASAQMGASSSPLALKNISAGSMLVKKRKNVQRTTVSTQTDDSYLMKMAQSKRPVY